MEIIHSRCAGMDVSKRDAKVRDRVAGAGLRKIRVRAAATRPALAARPSGTVRGRFNGRASTSPPNRCFDCVEVIGNASPSGRPSPKSKVSWFACGRCRATAFNTSISSGVSADPMCSISRDSRRFECTIWTATAPLAVFTVRNVRSHDRLKNPDACTPRRPKPLVSSNFNAQNRQKWLKSGTTLRA